MWIVRGNLLPSDFNLLTASMYLENMIYYKYIKHFEKDQIQWIPSWATTCHKRPLSNHLTKIWIGSSVSQIAMSETSCKRPPPVSNCTQAWHQGGRLSEAPL